MISLIIQTQRGSTIKLIFAQKHHLGDFLSWLASAAWHLEHELPPSYLPLKESLAEAIEAFYSTATDEMIESVSDDLFAYRSRHDLRFGFRGTDIPSTIIGVWKNYVTLSSATEGGYSERVNIRKLLNLVQENG